MMEQGVDRRQFLRRVAAGTAGLLLPRPLAGAGATKNSAPNFVVILAEARGWSSTSIQMDDARLGSKNRSAQTPNLVRLAERGMRFTQAYAPSPRCTPSRAALLTGKTPAQLHMTFVVDENEGKNKVNPALHPLTPPSCLLDMPESETTIAELLKRMGYATAHFGKWHAGHIDPTRHGFDESDGPTGNRGPGNTGYPNPQEAYGITERGIAFAKRQVQASKPFYLQLSHYNAHNPEDVSAAALAAFMNRTGVQDKNAASPAAGMVEMDSTIGTLLAALDAMGVADTTYVIYTSDHGSQGRNENSPLSGGKGSLWEGGIRVPLIVRGPSVKAGAVSRVAAVGHDLFPTIAELARASGPMPKGIEGGSLVPVLTGSSENAVKRANEELVFHFPHYDHDVNGPGSALILGNDKLIRFYETGKLYLFDLSKDIGEQRNLADAMPDKAKALERRLDAYLTSVNAQMPTRNAQYVPGTAPDAPPGGRRRNADGGPRPDGPSANGKGSGKGRKGQRKNQPLSSAKEVANGFTLG